MSFVGFKLNFIDFLVLFGKLIIVEVHNISQSNIAGVEHVNFDALLFTRSEFEQEEMVIDSHDKVKRVDVVADKLSEGLSKLIQFF